LSDVFASVERCQTLLYRFYKGDFMLQKGVDLFTNDIFSIPSGTLARHPVVAPGDRRSRQKGQPRSNCSRFRLGEAIPRRMVYGGANYDRKVISLRMPFRNDMGRRNDKKGGVAVVKNTRKKG
jgi:hypothetical protein